MLFNLNNDFELSKFNARCEFLKDKGANVELTEKVRARTLPQNAYLHVIISLYAIEMGDSRYEAKIDLKRLCDFMHYEKNGKKYLKETSKMDTKELGEFIDWILIYAGKNGLYIPSSEQYLENKFYIDSEIDRHKKYL